MKRISFFIGILLTSVIFSSAVAVQIFAGDPVIAKADKFINAMNSGDFQTAYTLLNADLGFQITAADLRKSWNNLIAKAGPFIKVKKKQVEMKKGYFIVTEVVQFKKGHVDLLIAIDNTMGVADFRYQNHKGKEPPPKSGNSASKEPTAAGSAPGANNSTAAAPTAAPASAGSTASATPAKDPTPAG